MNSDIHKPPVAPKPKPATSPKAFLSPQVPGQNGLTLSPGTAEKTKPPVAPKPPKPASESPWNKGLHNSQNGIQQSKKPEWDYVIPICLCSQENCTCIRTTNVKQKEKNVKPLHSKTEENELLSSGKQCVNGGTASDVRWQVKNSSSTDAPVINHKHFRDKPNIARTLSGDSGTSSPRTVGLPLPHRTNAETKAVSPTERGQKDDCFSSEQTSVLQPKPVLKPSRKPPPVPVQRKPRAAASSHQEKVEDKREETAVQERRDVRVKEVKMSSDRKGSSSMSVSALNSQNNQLAYLCARKACPPPTRIKPHPDARKVPTPLVKTPAEDVQHEESDLDAKPNKVEKSVSQTDHRNKKGGEHQEETHHLPSSPSVSRPDLSKPPLTTTATEEKRMVKTSSKKHCRHNSTSSLMQHKESPEEKEVDKSEECVPRMVNTSNNDTLKRELPVPPPFGKAAGKISASGAKLSKKKSRSFSSADTLGSDGSKGNSFRKVLELKLGKMMPPKKAAKESQNPYATSSDVDRSTHNDHDDYQEVSEHPHLERKLPSLQSGVEQNVDGDEFFPGVKEDALYDSIGIYEEILDYENVDVGNMGTCPPAAHTKDWQRDEYNDENIYEEQEPYFSLEKNIHQAKTRTEGDRSFDKKLSFLSDSFDDTSEEEEDSSSLSSKGDPEELGEQTLQREKKKSKIQYIATEIMSSESVFVDILKLLHVDFRNSVDVASQQHGKPVIEERLLNQILYYLPQLHELNEDLLRELTQRVDHWDENSQIADIFLKKGPFLKMYSTYIREFDKNVALLEEQTKKNPAFGAVVKEFQASPRCANLALKHYLLKPVQRIPQYQLLLTDYLKNLSEDSKDYVDTQAALALVKEVASHANDTIKHGDNFEKLMQVQSCLSGNHHEIIQPGRVFLKEGVLMKLSRKVMQPSMFFLFNDALLYTVPIQSAQYKLKNMMSLAGIKVSKPSQEAYQNELNIESVERSFTLSASSASERDEWLESISMAIDEYTKKKISFISGKPPDEEQVRNVDDDDGANLGSKAPIWIPDLRTTMCMICTCEFTLTWRRHHCRACGKVVCQACSFNKHCLAYKKNQPARVCDQCFAVLQQRSEMTSSAPPATGSKTAFVFIRKQKKIPATLTEVTANTDNSSMSGYLMRSKQAKKQGKRLWFVIKDKVLYTYAASEDVAALESQPLLGFMLKVDPLQKLQFKLYHKNTLCYIYKADDIQTAQRWISSFKEATVL
ncbi:FYVE, RhoGEF and PH domain-containing protein 6 [Nothobranchius furzeri]|uniref:FYVE, RhoGEF and PH domain-containing protein 6 n=1 Tax=Nothobranchius furzeri TaxID=105023 RepID=UPI00077D1084|nr:FYVE, RhoGEF and PH domain-containing protein 6 [Nothobranchius furzeri]